MIAHVGTGVVGSCGQFVLTVSATEGFFYFEGSVDVDQRGRRGGCIAAAIDLAYAGQMTAVDDDVCIGLCLFFLSTRGCCGFVGREVAATVDGFHVIASRHLVLKGGFAFALRGIHVNGDSSLGASVHVVASENLVHDAAFGIIGYAVVEFHEDVAVDLACLFDARQILRAALATAEYAAVAVGRIARTDGCTDGSTRDVDGGIACQRAHLCTAVNVALNGSARDADYGVLGLCHVCPVGEKGRSVKSIETSHASGKDVAALGVGQSVTIVEGREGHLALVRSTGVGHVFIVVADGAARDVDGDVAMGDAFRHYVGVVGSDDLFVSVGNLLAIVGMVVGHKVGAHRAQTTSAVDAAKHCAPLNIYSYISAHSPCRQCVTAEATAGTEHVSVNIGGTPCANDGIGL